MPSKNKGLYCSVIGILPMFFNRRGALHKHLKGLKI